MDLDQLKIDVGYMMEALREAKLAFDEEEVPIGCVVVSNTKRESKIIARGHNLTQLLKDPTAHAEMQAITAATYELGGKYLKNCTIYVTVEPCPMCASALNWAQIDRVVYGCKDEKRGASLFDKNLYHPKTKVVGGVLETECAEIIKNFFAVRRK